MRAGLVLVVLVSSTFLGCLTSPAALDQAATPAVTSRAELLDLGKVLPARIPLADGLKLAGTVYLPNVAEGEKVPVIMDMGPYYGNLNPDTDVHSKDHPPSLLYEHFLRRGYAIALVSVRGTGLSEGCFMIGGPEERADVVAAVEWLAAQPWSDGNVAMSGVSYDGTTPWEAYVAAAPHLRAIVPVEGISDFYRYSFFEGAPVGGGAAFNTYYLAMVDVAYATPTHVVEWAPQLTSNICPEQAEVYLSPYNTYRDGVHGAYWDERDMSSMVANATAAVFVVHGLKDFNVKADHVQTIWADLPAPKRMLLGQWEHNIPWRNSFDKEQSWEAYNDTILQFLDAHVRGDPAALAAEQQASPVLVQTSANRTLNLTQWPPAESVDTRAYLGAGGKLSWAPAEPGKATLKTSVVREAALLTPIGGMAPLPSGAITFETEPFAEDTLLMGNPWIELDVSVDRGEGVLQAELYETGEETNSGGLISLGWQNLATRESRDKASDVPTDKPMKIRILLEAIAQHVEKGHTLRLVLTPETDATLTPRMQATTFTVTLGGAEGAALVLPVFAPTP